MSDGREIENYYDFEARQEAVKLAHSHAVRLTGSRNRYGKPLNYEDDKGENHDKGFDKVKIARILTTKDYAPHEAAVSKTQELVAFIRRANLSEDRPATN
jgi:hypothetical protein